MEKACKEDWVQIHSIVLKPEERTAHLPEDTRKVPFEMWIKGFINCDAKIGDHVEVTTITGRIEEGELVGINPKYSHDFGKCIPELLFIGPQVRRIIEEGL
jgi:hypothetical protein